VKHTPDRDAANEARFLRRRRFARESALQALYQSDVSGDWDWSKPGRWKEFWVQTEDADRWLPEPEQSEARRFTRRLVRLVAEHREEIDRAVEQCVHNWSLDRMNVVDRNILRLAACELLYQPNTPPVAVVNEAVELAKTFGDQQSSRFVNGVLDALLRRRREGEIAPDAAADAPPQGDAGS